MAEHCGNCGSQQTAGGLARCLRARRGIPDPMAVAGGIEYQERATGCPGWTRASASSPPSAPASGPASLILAKLAAIETAIERLTALIEHIQQVPSEERPA